MNPADRSPLLVFSDDWGRHPSSCQHLIRHLLPRRHVVWVNTIGMRPPSFDWHTVRRGFDKIREWTGLRSVQKPSGDANGPSPHVLSPKMWPSFRSRITRGLNRRLLTRALRPVIEKLPLPPIVVTTIPLLADLVGQIPAAKWVYYCVDDFAVWPGLDGDTVRTMEREFVAKADRVIAVSETLQEHIAKLGKPSHLLTHGVDLDHWRQPIASSLPALESVPSPRIVFWGVVDPRMDVSFLRQLGERLTEGSILLVGPKDDPDPQLLAIPHVHAWPALPYADLPALASAASVLVMPYADLPVTRAMQPLKLKEYLATGKPVVVRDLPATRPWADCMDVVATPEEFESRVLERLQTGVPAEQQAARLTRLEAEGWEWKAKQFEEWLDA